MEDNKEKIWSLDNEPLRVGESYKYSQLTKLLDEKYFGCGSSRQYQFNRWGSRYTLRKIEGQHKYIVDEIRYDIPIPPAQTTKEKQKYQNYIYAIILTYLKEQSDKVSNKDSDFDMCFLSRNDLQKIAGFMNDIYTYTAGKYEKMMFKKTFPHVANQIENELWQHAYNVTTHSLKKLKENSLINYTYEIQIMWKEHPKMWYTATKKDIELLRANRKEVLDSFGLDDDKYKKLSPESKRYFRMELNERNALDGIEKDREVICIWLPKHVVSKELDRLSLIFDEDETLREYIEAINKKAIEAITEKTQTNIDNRSKYYTLTGHKKERFLTQWVFIVNEIKKYNNEEQMNCLKIDKIWNELSDVIDDEYKAVRQKGINVYAKLPNDGIVPSEQIKWISSRNANRTTLNENGDHITIVEATDEEMEEDAHFEDIEFPDNQ